jgi:hypothetical protein
MLSEMKRLRQLEEENTQLKCLVANLSLDKEMLQDVIRRSLAGSAACGYLCQSYWIRVRRIGPLNLPLSLPLARPGQRIREMPARSCHASPERVGAQP